MRSDIKAIQLFIDQMVGIPQFSYPVVSSTGTGKRPPRPTGNHCTIKLLEEYQESIPAEFPIPDESDDDITTTLTRSLSRLRFRIALVDEDGTAAVRIMNGWTSEAMKELMFSTGFGFIGLSPISNEDAKLEHTEWESRQGFSLLVYVERNFKNTVNNIRQVVGTGEFITPALDTLLVNFDVNNYD